MWASNPTAVSRYQVSIVKNLRSTTIKIDVYQVDAFASRAFEGNPAAVCPLDSWLPDAVLQSIAAENNLSETAFFVADGDDFKIRWFTPTTEVDLCGHATLASAFVLFRILDYPGDTVIFDSKSGPLPVSKDGDRFVLDFPAQSPRPCATPAAIVEAFGVTPLECLRAVDYVVILENAEQVTLADPDIEKLRSIDSRGVIISAAARDYDFVARFFGPNAGVDEDPVTGSAYTKLVPYWAGKMGKSRFRARQVSKRGGDLFCELAGERVLIAGTAVKFMQGIIQIEHDE
jgi:PhzF family phenazine biosynthesis protein